MFEFIVLKKFLKNPIHHPLGCFSHLSITFIFSYIYIYIYMVQTQHIYIEINKFLFLNFWNPQFFINLVIQYLQTLDMSISCLQSFIVYPLPPTQSFFTYKFVPIWKYWPILVYLLCGNIEDRRQRRRRCFHKRAILILTLNKIAIMSENYINIVVKLSLWGWSCYLISTIEERSVSFQQTSREVHLIYLIIF